MQNKCDKKFKQEATCAHQQRVTISDPSLKTEAIDVPRLDDDVKQDVGKQTHFHPSYSSSFNVAVEPRQVDCAKGFARYASSMAVLKQRGVQVKQIVVGIVPA
jgi:hypothetical protein